MLRKRLMTASAAAALFLAPTAIAQETDPVSPANTPPDAMQTNPMEPPPPAPGHSKVRAWLLEKPWA